MELIGWLGSALLALCALPQAVQCVREGHAKGLSFGFLLMWGLGEVLTLAYVWPKADLPLIANYIGNLGLLCVMLRYKLFERNP